MIRSLESSSIKPKVQIILASGSESRKQMLEEAGILFDEVNVDKGVTKKSDSVKTLKDMTDKELKDQLNSSITEENYEFAARIRDEIKKRN